MSKNFWKNLKKPFIAMAPMADITNAAFRQIVGEIGKPDVIFTEFVACDGLASDKAREKLLAKLKFTSKERPIVAQFFGSRPDNFVKAAKIAARLKFDGIDINMGCPSRKIEKQGAGACLIKNPELARKIILSAKEAAPDMPVSVKTRLGYDEKSVDLWIKTLALANPATITIHGRLQKQGRKNSSDWLAIAEAVKIIKEINPEIVVVGNGDIKSVEESREKAKEYGLDGVMIGRAVIVNPWIFSERNPEEITLKERSQVAKKHLSLLRKETTRFPIAKKFLKAWFSDFIGANEIRMALMETKTWKEAEKILGRLR